MSSLKDLRKRINLLGNRVRILQIIDKNKKKEEFFLRSKASVPLLVYLLNNSRIKKLFVLPGVERIMPHKVKKAIQESGVEIIVCEEYIGRPQEINPKKFSEVLKEKITNKERIKKLKISRRNFYYWKKKIKK